MEFSGLLQSRLAACLSLFRHSEHLERLLEAPQAWSSKHCSCKG